MAGLGSSHDIATRDDAHPRSLVIKPELQPSLGFLSDFAVVEAVGDWIGFEIAREPLYDRTGERLRS